MKNAIILLLFTGLVFLAGWWVSDEPLDAAAQLWLEDTEEENAAYQYLIEMVGIDPPFDPDNIQQRLDSPHPTGPEPLEELQQKDLLCDNYTAACLLKQQQHTATGQALLSRFSPYLARYQHFLAFDDFKEMTPARIDTPFPRYRRLITLARLQSLNWAMNKDGQGLASEIERLRHLLAQHHSILSKVIVTRILSEKIQLAALLMQQGQPVSLSQYRLSTAEKSFRSALAYEFRFSTRVLQHDWRSHEFFGEHWLENLYYIIGLRENITTNRAFLFYQHYADLSENPSFIIANDVYQLPAPSLSQAIRNPAGNQLLESSLPHFTEYLSRLSHLDAQIQLLSWFRHHDPSLPNPWSPEGGMTLEKSSDEICFPSDFNSEKMRSCLPLLDADQHLEKQG